jgi:hypothetical protein
MVIEMTNGTKITIGPNDIRSLTFNNGELTVTGESLQSWMESVAKRDELDDLRVWIVDMQSNVAKRDELANVEMHVHGFLTPLVNYFGNGYDIDAYQVSEALVNRLKDYEDRIQMNDRRYNELENALENVFEKHEAEIYELKTMMADLQARIANLEAQ